MNSPISLMSANEMDDILDDLAERIISRHGADIPLALIGIQRRGVVLAKALNERLEKKRGHAALYGTLDITLYRDDWTTKTVKPSVGETRINFDVEDKTLILVDDVLFTGRTIRAALEALTDFGRPKRVELLVLVDRGNRELPIQPDYTGLTVYTERNDRVDVLLPPIDENKGVQLVQAND